MKHLSCSVFFCLFLASPLSADPFSGAIEGGLGGAIIGGIIDGEDGAVDGAWIGGAAGAIGGAMRAQEQDRGRYRDRFYQPYRAPTQYGTPQGNQGIQGAQQPAQHPAGGDSLVRDIQLELRRLGFNPGPADGVAGQATASALAAYNSANGLQNDGVITELLLFRMRNQ